MDELYRVTGLHRDYEYEPLEQKIFYIEAKNFPKVVTKAKKLFEYITSIEEIDGHIYKD